MQGVNNGTGTALIGVDDLDQTGPSKLINISTREYVGTGQNVAIAGFIISGTEPKQVLIRGLGPTLTSLGIPSGVLANPTMTLWWDHDNNWNTGMVAAMTNDNWGVALTCAAPATACGSPQDIIDTGMSANSYAPTNPNRGLDAAMLLTLPPGVYTVIMQGVSNGTGTALIGVDEVP
jgi:hypothetical protein